MVPPEEVVRAAVMAARQQAAGTTYDLAIAELDRALEAVEGRALDGAVAADCLLERGKVLMLSGDVVVLRRLRGVR